MIGKVDTLATCKCGRTISRHLKGEWITKYVKAEDTGRKFKAVFKCGWCGTTSETATNYCANCGDPKNGDELISRANTAEKIRHMRDIDGYRGGDAISRKAVIAIIEAQEREHYETY